MLLCDLASAAPFSFFDLVPSSGNLPEEDLSRISKVGQRRVLYRHCCLIGTADYIAPEIFWSADLISRRRERKLHRDQSNSRSHFSLDDSQATDDDDEEEDDDDEDDDEPPPDGPGLYGPECDWWSLGVVLFEMVYRRMPFFSEKIAETMEMIKNHESYFRLDSWVQVSPQLEDLILRLISHSEKRIGFSSSAEVKAHPMFKGVDWSKPWEGDAVPFVPNLQADVGLHSKSIGETSLWQQEPSVLHSPKWKQEYSNSTHLSQMWSGDPNEFPAFPNSVELSRPVIADQIDEEEEDNDQGEEEEDDSGATITNSSPSTRKVLQQNKNSTMIEAETLWATFDPTWIGFSYVPGKKVFVPVPETVCARLEGLPSPISSPGSMTAGTLLDTPQGSLTTLPMVSTPCRDSEDMSSAPLPIQSTPFHPSTAHNLRRRAMETASRVRSENVEPYTHQAFATPLRKTSMPNMASQSDRHQMISNLQTPANPSSSKNLTIVPASPYPFPVATVARPKKTPAAPRVPSSVLKRTDLERARSASASTGEGSDSRCSGGSNIKREISEREAWRELQVAVMQSARKGRRDFIKELEEKRRIPLQTAAVVKKRPPLTHAVTDSVVQAAAVIQPRSSIATNRGEGENLTRTASAFGLGALSGALKGKRPNLPRFLSQTNEIRGGKPAPLKPAVSLTSPKRQASIVSSSSPSSSPQGQFAQEPSSTSARSRLVLPGFWSRHGEGGKLNKKKSARQLLLKAQDRETPTKIASRSGSPLLTSFQNLSLGSNENEMSSQLDVNSPSTKLQDNLTTRRGVTNEPGGVTLDSNDSTASLRSFDQSSDAEQRLSSPPQSALIAQLKREESTATHRMRRRDSTEMLSHYRKGINPDETVEAFDLTSTQQFGKQLNQGMRRGMKRVLSVQVLQPKSSNRALAGLAGENSATSASSPSLPSFPDAFGGELEPESAKEDIRRASMFPLRTYEDENLELLSNNAGEGQQFRSLQSRRCGRMLGKRNSSSRLTIATRIGDYAGGELRSNNNKTSEGQQLLSANAARRSHLGVEEGIVGGGVGDVSMLSGLDWRYESMRENLSQVEERLERIKARLRED